MKTNTDLHFLKDLWDDQLAASLNAPELLRYRSNLLGADLRLTNFGGGNTSSKIEQNDPLTGEPTQVLWVKGSGGDLGSMKRAGFATLYLDRVRALKSQYKGVAREDEIVELYPLCTFGRNPVAASIDTPLHGFLPFPHVDHLHPDWGIALAAAANGRAKMEQFNEQFGHKLVWLPWQRPGFELAMMMHRAVQENADCDGIVLGGHGLFTWGQTQRESYLNTLTIIDQLGQFIARHEQRRRLPSFGGEHAKPRNEGSKLAYELMPTIRGMVSEKKKLIGSFTNLPEVERFVNSKDAAALAHLGTSCPDHFIRTKIRPLYVPVDHTASMAEIKLALASAIEVYRAEYAAYYQKHAMPDSPAMRDANPTVVLVPGIGMFSFGKNKTESRITGEFYTNAIHVMEGASMLTDEATLAEIPQAGAAAPREAFEVHSNYVALPLSEAFGIEYWALEEAKIRRQPAEKELSRQIALIVGGASGIGRATAQLAAERGAHIMIADLDQASAAAAAQQLMAITGKEAIASCAIDIRNRSSIREAISQTIEHFGGLDLLVNTAAVFPSTPDGVIPDAMWGTTLEINVTANFILAEETAKIFAEQKLESSIVLTSSANAVVPKRGSEAYDVSKAALSHLVRELAVSLAPQVRVNGICPATVVKGSTMFPRDRVIASLSKYKIAFDEASADDDLRTLLSEFYARRTLTHQPIEPDDCAQAILFLAGPKTRCTSGHLIPVDGGLPEAFLR